MKLKLIGIAAVVVAAVIILALLIIPSGHVNSHNRCIAGSCYYVKNGFVVVTNKSTNSTLKTIPITRSSTATTPNGKYILNAERLSITVSVFDTSNMSERNISLVNATAWTIIASPDNAHAYVISTDGFLFVLNIENGTVESRIPINASYPDAGAFSYNASRLYIIDGCYAGQGNYACQNLITVINTTAGRIIGNVYANTTDYTWGV
ncbi:MAG: hypothetical protein M1528_00135 [Candidatus Marsarchaeota archaeon]|nr:hypothetical protein [Candidatus Marsarchaeota archaeon]MCL5114941.1 hypothetical protein [Candidatus Marsarchaeota archaeon]